MTIPGDGPLRIALLHHRYGSPPRDGAERHVRELAGALHAAGHRPEVVSSHGGATRRSVEDGLPVTRCRRPPDAQLRWRGFSGPLTQLPFTLRTLLSGAYDAAHAFSPPDALAALWWRRFAGRPAVYTCCEAVGRERLADARLRLRLVARAVEDSDAVTAPKEEIEASMWRWLAVEPAVIAPSDAAAHERLYRELIARRS